jgi:hypothetical protein
MRESEEIGPMKTLILTTLSVALVLVATLPTVAVAGNNPDAVLALHIGTRTGKGLCAVSLPTDCQSYVTDTIDSGFFNLYLTVSNYDTMGVAGLQFGIDYDDAIGQGADISGWTSCSDMEFAASEWPDASSGNLMTWEYLGNCQGDVDTFEPVLAGVFEITAYSGDVFSITPRPVDGRAKVADCLGAENDITGMTPSRLATISFGLGTGYNPCETQVPVRRTTWGSIKSLFEN